MADTLHDDTAASANVVWLHRECPEYIRVIHECRIALTYAILDAPKRYRDELVKTTANDIALWVRLGDAFSGARAEEEPTTGRQRPTSAPLARHGHVVPVAPHSYVNA